MTRLALGTVQFGIPYGIANKSGQVSHQEAQSMLDVASVSGVDTLDTAVAYGESELRLGVIGVVGFKIVTKLPALPLGVVDVDAWTLNHITKSLERLKVSSLYGLLLHRADQLLERRGGELYRSMVRMKHLGLVQKIGISIYSPRELDLIVPLYSLDLVQAPFNLIDRRLRSSGWMARLKDCGVEVHVRSVFLQGLLLMDCKELPPKFLRWSHLWSTWNEWIVDGDIARVNACLGFALAQPEIDRIVVGTDNLTQLKQLINAAEQSSFSKFPAIACDEEDLINPVRWNNL